MLGLPEAVHACLFDLDGVLTDTASVHTKAWKVMFDAFLQQHAKQTGEPIAVIPDEKIDDILRRKQWMGLPDARMGRIGGDPRGEEPRNTAEIVELVKKETGRVKGSR